jgi:hypothetical protein
MSSDKEKCINTITELFDKYSDTEGKSNDMPKYLTTFITQSIPLHMCNILETRKNRTKRRITLEQDSKKLKEEFISLHNIYYIPTNNTYVCYEYTQNDTPKYKFVIKKEDDIHVDILNAIAYVPSIKPWKYKIKNNILKCIKERNFYKCIPETSTIQDVLNKLKMCAFPSKLHAKYFLSVIGDNILKKHIGKYKHYLPKHAETFICELIANSYNVLGISSIVKSITTTSNGSASTLAHYRLLDPTSTISSADCITYCIKERLLEIVCVACHYSRRYGTSNQFISQTNQPLFVNKICMLENETLAKITEKFVNYLDNCSSTHDTNDNSNNDINNTAETTKPPENTIPIKWNIMHFLWKQFLNKHGIPNIASEKAVIVELNKILINNPQSVTVCPVYNLRRNAFIDTVYNCMEFWTNYIIVDCDEMELEVDEVCSLYNTWSVSQGNDAIISDTDMIDYIRHFATTFYIDNDKYIANCRCLLWDKKTDIHVILEEYRHYIKKSCNDEEFISIYRVYEHYCKYSNAVNKKIVSKRYFEGYIQEYMSEFIVNDYFLSRKWWS